MQRYSVPYANFWVMIFLSLFDGNETKNLIWDGESELVLVHTIFRHGERNPQFLIPSDVKNNISTWFQQSLGELTLRGMQEINYLGHQFGQKYRNFLDLKIAAKQVYMRSTDRNRTLASAQAFISGLLEGHYGPSAFSKLPKNYNPIPVHTIHGPSDSVVLVGTHCQKAKDILENKVWKTKEWLDTTKKNQDFIAWLEAKSKIENLTLDQLWKIIDPLTIEMLYPKLHLWPSWVNASVLARTQRLADFVTLRKYHRHSLARLRGGQLLGEILDRMKHKIHCSTYSHKAISESSHENPCSWMSHLRFYAYSAHESTLLALLETLVRGDVNGEPTASVLTKGSFPGSGAVILVEFWRKKEGKYFVKISYKNSYKLPFITVRVSEGCDKTEFCEFDTFNKRSLPYIPTDWQTECSAKMEQHKVQERVDKSIGFWDFPDASNGGNMTFAQESPSLKSGVTKKRAYSLCKCPTSGWNVELLAYKLLALSFAALFTISFFWNIRQMHSARTNDSNGPSSKLKLGE